MRASPINAQLPDANCFGVEASLGFVVVINPEAKNASSKSANAASRMSDALGSSSVMLEPGRGRGGVVMAASKALFGSIGAAVKIDFIVQC